MNWIDNLFKSYTVSGIIGDIKKQFKNKEIHEIMDYHVKPALEDKNMYIESAEFRNFTLLSKVDSTSINVEIETFIDQITYVKIYLYFREKDNDNNDMEYTVEYEINTDKDKEKITIRDNECKITRNANNITSKVEIASKIQTFLDNNLRYEFLDINTTDLVTSSKSNHTVMETYIDLDKRAVRREVTYKEEIPLDIKYLEADEFYANPFEDLYGIPHAINNKLNESTEENFNEFINGGNNLSLILEGK